MKTPTVKRRHGIVVTVRQLAQWASTVSGKFAVIRRAPALALMPLFICLVRLDGAPPPTIAGLLYSETIRSAGGITNAHRLVEFGPDGRWRDLAAFTDIRPAFVPAARERSAGSFTYRIVSDMEAVITMIVEEGLASPNGPVRFLRFTHAVEGDLLELVPGLSGRFHLGPAQADVPLVNQSSRAFISNSRPLRSGFVLREPSYVLVRAIGPGLIPFGVPQTARNPSVTVTQRTLLVGTNDDWNDDLTAVTRASQLVGAFPLPPRSGDAALLLRLNAGEYVATATSEGDDSGEALLEIYFLSSMQLR